MGPGDDAVDAASLRGASSEIPTSRHHWNATEAAAYANDPMHAAGAAHLDAAQTAHVPSPHEGMTSSHGAAQSSGRTGSEQRVTAGRRGAREDDVHSAAHTGSWATDGPATSQPALKRARLQAGQDPATEDARAQHVQEKNRQAQARFRQRQKACSRTPSGLPRDAAGVQPHEHSPNNSVPVPCRGAL